MPLIQSYGREPGYPEFNKTWQAGVGNVVGYTDRWKIIVTDPNALGEEILANLPSDFQVGASHGLFARITNVKLKRDAQNRLLYYYDSTSTSQFDDEEQEDQNQPPDLRRPRVNWDFETLTFAFTKDADSGEAVTNSAGDPYEVTREIAIPVLSIQGAQAYFDPDAIINYVNHRNSGSFWGAPAGSAVVSGIRDTPGEVYQNFQYRSVTYIVKFFLPYISGVMEGATLILLDMGRQYIGDDEELHLFKTDGHNALGKLDDDGTRMADQTAAALVKRFNQFPTANFNDLGINIHQI